MTRPNHEPAPAAARATIPSEDDGTAVERIVDMLQAGEATRPLVDPPAWMDLDLTFGQLRLVYLLSQQGPQSIGHIAERFGLTMTAASQFADRIERQGLAERHHRSDDRRVVELRLTEPGSALVAGMLGMQRDVLRDLFSVFTSAELEQLERLVRTMVERHGARASVAADRAASINSPMPTPTR
ncbi:MAG TPA: MarR family winged helix-turn-helix transcriptional regulator [Candidatus Saccharimonadia bacterium]|nr:MarR family winged helix-turn-helix transcriptional regulator [Candidatus Saccharimonadia bacterium]